MNVHPSALKHGVASKDAIQAASWPLWIEDLDDGNPGRQLRIGFDTQGRNPCRAGLGDQPSIMV